MRGLFQRSARVPDANLIGTEGGAFRQSMRQLEHEHGGIDRLVSNLRSYRLALREANTTDPLLRQEIAGIEIGYRIGRLLVTKQIVGQALAGFSAATKIFCTEHEQRVAAFVARVLGADATLVCDLTLEVCYAPGYTIMGGTSNVLRNVLAERVLGLPKEPPPPAQRIADSLPSTDR